MNLLGLLRAEPRALAFGLLCTLASSPGQTYLIALFLPGIKEASGLGDAQIASLYAVATVASATVLWRIGRRVDDADAVRYSLAAAILLLLAGLLLISARSVLWLGVALFALRLAGQGLLSHVATTAIARYFIEGRGKALSITALGYSVGEGLLPAAVVLCTALWDWRAAVLAAGLLSVVLVSAAGALVRGERRFRRLPREAASSPASARSRDTAGVRLSSPYMLLAWPLFLANPLISTGLVFHQGAIAHAKGYSLQWFALAFTAFAVARVGGTVLVGPAADRFGARGLFAIHLVPMAVGVASLAAGSAAWLVPLYWAMLGLSSGMSGTLHAAVIAELVPARRIGAVRSVFASTMILATAAGPALYGWLLSSGVPMDTTLWATGVVVAVVSLLGWAALVRVGTYQPS